MKKILSEVFTRNGNFPNNPDLPVLIYKNVLKDMSPEETLKHFKKNGWVRGWVDGIYSYHHYHSNTHEVIGICGGIALVQLGGEQGSIFELEMNDVLILPAGVAHKKVKAMDDFVCVGAYPFDIEYDMQEGHAVLPMAAEQISSLALPKTDPVFGKKGPLFDYWKKTKTYHK